jgi:4-hydroxy-tetrahydrodipicolinate synthase
MILRQRDAWRGVWPATMVPFRDDGDWSVDEAGLRAHTRRFLAVAGVRGLVANGHSGEVQALSNAERRRVVEIMVDELAGALPVVSGVCAESVVDAVEQARAARQAGAAAILLMPPHAWLRFGRDSATALRYVECIAERVEIGIIIHQYPAWTRVAYSTQELLDIVRIPNVVAIKEGTRDFARYERNVRALRDAAPDVAILSCHDEYLLPTLLLAIDGVLVSLAAVVPELVCSLVEAVWREDWTAARAVHERLYALTQTVYHADEVSWDAHQRLKAAAFLLGELRSPAVRPPLHPLDRAALDGLRRALHAAGLLPTPALP